MRALVQRVKRSSVIIEGEVKSSIQKGVLILLGVKTDDAESDARYLAERCAALRIFDDDQGKMNLSLLEVKGDALVVSQFTLYGDTRKGNRPSYTDAAPHHLAESLYETFVHHLKQSIGETHVQTGVFRAMMDIELVNDGPVTVMLESKNSAHQ